MLAGEFPGSSQSTFMLKASAQRTSSSETCLPTLVQSDLLKSSKQLGSFLVCFPRDWKKIQLHFLRQKVNVNWKSIFDGLEKAEISGEIRMNP